MKSSRTFGNIVVVAIVAAMWCLACTVYHAELPDPHVVYFGTMMTGSEVIATVWSAWALLTTVALAVGYGVTWSSRQDRILNAPMVEEPWEIIVHRFNAQVLRTY